MMQYRYCPDLTWPEVRLSEGEVDGTRRHSLFPSFFCFFFFFRLIPSLLFESFTLMGMSACFHVIEERSGHL